MILNFDYSSFDPTSDFFYPPEGFYTLAIVDEKINTEDRDYTFLTLAFEIAEGPLVKRRFYIDYLTGYNRDNDKPIEKRTATIAMKNLGRIYYAAVHELPPADGLDTAKLRNKAFRANVKLNKKPSQKDPEKINIFINLSGFKSMIDEVPVAENKTEQASTELLEPSKPVEKRDELINNPAWAL